MTGFYIYDTALNPLQAVTQAKSIIWTGRYYAPGDFEIYTPATTESLALYTRGRYIGRDDHPEQMGIIEKVRITTSAKEGDWLIVSGRHLAGLLDRRIVWKQTTHTGKAEKAIRRLLEANAISPDDADRAMPLTLASPHGYAATITAQYNGDNLGAAIQALCKDAKLGFIIEYTGGSFVFRLYAGADRTTDQTANPPVIFSPGFANLFSSEMVEDAQAYRNVALIAGEGEGIAKQKATVGSQTGLDRFEIFVNAGKKSTNGGEFDSATYGAILSQKGAEALAVAKITESITGEVEATSVFKINQDFFLGDIVEVANSYGASYKPRVIEVIESWSDKGYTCVPRFAVDAV